MKKILSLTNLLFILTLAMELTPSGRTVHNTWFIVVPIVSIQLYYLSVLLFAKNREKVLSNGDVISVVYIIVFIWDMLTSKLNIVDKMLYPTAGTVVAMFLTELPELFKGLFSSLQLLVSGYILALAAAIPLALVIGWRKRLYNAVKPFTKVLGPIPPIVYIPYAIAILPTFKASSIFIIFTGAFWPIFINTLNGVFNIDKKIIDSARALNVKERTMLFEIILPGAIPSILSGATIGLVLSFILLTAAEMIGATSGLGWYVKYFSDFAEYHKVIVGIIFIGIVVTAITYLMDKLEHYLLRWKK